MTFPYIDKHVLLFTEARKYASIFVYRLSTAGPRFLLLRTVIEDSGGGGIYFGLSVCLFAKTFFYVINIF